MLYLVKSNLITQWTLKIIQYERKSDYSAPTNNNVKYMVAYSSNDETNTNKNSKNTKNIKGDNKLQVTKCVRKKKAGQYERADRTFTSQNNWKIYIFL